MNYYSLNNNAPNVSFKDAVIRGLAPDRGLYFPEKIPPLPKEFIDNIEAFSNEEIALKVIQPFIGNEIPESALKKIISETLCFDFPVVEIDKNTATLELFQGPTMAFKDVGARFMARCLGYFNTHETEEEITVLVATSGDTGGAVASGFLGVKGIKVVILYPSGKVSDVQERQLTTNGQNVSALEVNGVFDDCQEMVKTAFLDQDLKNNMKLTSANSINVARWLPQMFYFFFAYKTLKKQGNTKKLVFSVPSGNFGNICAGLMAHQLGLPIFHLVASTNINDTVPKYMEAGVYEPKPSQETISNAMDVGNPSNFIRIQKIVNNDLHKLKKTFSSFSFTDKETRKALSEIRSLKGKYIADPHGAVGYLGLKKYMETNDQVFGVFLETAHPIKFKDTVEQQLGLKLDIPSQIEAVLTKEKESIHIEDYQQLKSYLLQS
jgi:threonine synthase